MAQDVVQSCEHDVETPSSMKVINLSNELLSASQGLFSMLFVIDSAQEMHSTLACS
jgi:hypothetical protein